MKKHLTWLVIVGASPLVSWAQDSDPDLKKPLNAVILEGLRAESIEPINLNLAMTKFRKTLVRAKKEQDAGVAAEALVRLARCSEKIDSDNLTVAMAAYQEVASDYNGVKPWSGIAKEALAQKGVDVWLRQLDQWLDAWRITLDSSPQAPMLKEKKDAAAQKILALGKDAIYGLISGLQNPDSVMREWSAQWLSEVVDGPGIATVVTKLNDPSPAMRAGAATALRKIFQRRNDALNLDRRANNIEIEMTRVRIDRAQGIRDRMAQEVLDLRKSAAEVRKNIPGSLDTQAIQWSLETILGDESAFVEARREAAGALSRIGPLSGKLVDALVKGMGSRDRDVREACCRAGGAADVAQIDDRSRIVDRLMKALTYEPARDLEPETADWSNDVVVRQASAASLEQLGAIKSLPALIEALGDNNVSVRSAAYRAIKQIVHRDLKVEGNEGYEPDQPLAQRKLGQSTWEKWWKATGGIPVLMDRFWTFQSQYGEQDVVVLFDPSFYLWTVQSHHWEQEDPKASMERAQKVVKDFDHFKEGFVQEAIDLGPGSLPRFLDYLGGETPREPQPNPAVRTFVAQVCARLILQYSIPGGADTLREILLHGDSGTKKGGAALALGFLGRDHVGIPDRQALEETGLGSGDPAVREAAARALGTVGDDHAAQALTRSVLDPNQGVALASLRALLNLHPTSEESVSALGKVITTAVPAGATLSSKIDTVRAAQLRELAAENLGNMGAESAMDYLMRARTDEMQQVRKAAIMAVRRIHTLHPAESVERCLKVLRDPKRRSEERIGAALCIGDYDNPALGRVLAGCLTGEYPPRSLREPDAGVRVKICEALGNMGEQGKTLTVVDILIRSMADDTEEGMVRDAAYHALVRIRGIDPDKKDSPDREFLFKTGESQQTREEVLSKWRTWFSTVKSSLKDPV